MIVDKAVAVIGGGPTGLGAAWRLNELGHQDWALYEGSSHVGGLAASCIDDKGFTWDMGGHVLFSHYKYFDNLMLTALGDQWVEHIREAWVWMRERWIPYPLQNNVWRLPEVELMSCLEGLLEIYKRSQPNRLPLASFREWLLASFGPGLCDSFMFPYNRKVWAFDPAKLDVGWMGERVATVDFPRLLRNLVFRHDDVGWGPNSTFRFPLRGGTGAIWKAVSERLPQNRIHLQHKLIRMNLKEKTLFFENGERVRYGRLISTIPLDALLKMLDDAPDLTARTKHFVHSSTHIVGVGLAGQTPDALKTKCWMYFPEIEVPFYRCTVFSNYSPNNVPNPGAEWSLMAEVSESVDKPVDSGTVENEVIEGLRRCRLIGPEASIVSVWHRRLEYGYPTPWLGRDEVLNPVDAELRSAGVFSRGRFGAWKYEVSNQDHSVMQGVEAVNHIACGSTERTYYGNMSD